MSIPGRGQWGWAWFLTGFLAFSATAKDEAPLGLALPSQTMGVAKSAQGREVVWSLWARNQAEVDRRQRVDRWPTAFSKQVEQEKGSIESALIEQGVLTTTHDWPAGCTSFAQTLEQSLPTVLTPRDMEHWLNWMTVFRVSCSNDTERWEPVWRHGVANRLEAMGRWVTEPFEKAVARSDALDTFLNPLLPELSQCLVQAQPEALRQGLDRHEGLRFMATSCGVSSAVLFGSAAQCLECGPHPRRRLSRLSQALVFAWP